MTRLIWSNDEPNGRHVLRAGEVAPRFRLPDQHGRAVTLNGLLGKGAVVLRFCRHDGTSSCLRELDALVAVHVEIERRGATLAVIAAPPLHPHPANQDLGAYAFPLLTDKGSRVARSHGLTYRLPMDPSPTAAADRHTSSRQMGPIGSAPATYIVDQECVVALAFVDLEGRNRMEPDQITMALECLNKRKNLKGGPLDGAGRGEKP